jgi:enterochelin esterase-like enzyme
MRHAFWMLLFVSCGAAAQGPPVAPDDANKYYDLSPDSLAKDGVPQGEVKGPFVLPSKAYPGTQHDYWIYVPKQYDGKTPVALMVFQDGQAFKNPDGDIRAPTVLDNLIVRREIPLMIAVFVNPGRTPEQPMATPTEWGDHSSNRPAEYNTLDDKYARVVVDELLPVIYAQYNVARDPAMHGIGGSSSGAIAAFTVAWERPDVFRKVLSNVGSFVNLRGGDAYADIVKKAKKKPLRIFMVDGRNDNRGRPDAPYDARKDWFLQNVRLKNALAAKGYELNYSWGIQKHGQAMLRTVFPEMMRWLWRDQAVSDDPANVVERAFNQ